VVRYPDVAAYSVSHLGCCDLPKRGVIHHGKHEATHCRGVTTGMVMLRVLSRTFRRRKPQSPRPQLALLYRPPQLAELEETL
jgi:hypothetical protein